MTAGWFPSARRLVVDMAGPGSGVQEPVSCAERPRVCHPLWAGDGQRVTDPSYAWSQQNCSWQPLRLVSLPARSLPARRAHFLYLRVASRVRTGT